MRRWRRTALGLAVLAAVALGGCGLPSDAHPQAIKSDDVPFGLADTTTTSTTTTTVPPATTTTTVPTTTTTVPADPVTVWFILNTKLQPVIRQLPRPVDTSKVLDQLNSPKESEQPAGMRSAVPVGSVTSVAVSGGVATVDLAPTFVLNTPNPDQVLAFGQMVLTLTSRPGVGQVRFTTSGHPQQAILPDGSLSTDPLSADRYAALRNA
jgi:spore germination protein GerM